MRLLDQNGVLMLSQSSRRNTTLKITASKETLFHWLNKNQKSAGILQSLLRTYGGLFDFDTKINIPRMAKKTGVPEQHIILTLERLHKDELAIFTARQDDLQISFLTPREDDVTINAIATHIQQLNRTKMYKLDRLLEYAENTRHCRARFLLDYFGENAAKKCGQCDICSAKKKNRFPENSLESQILNVLAGGEMASRALAAVLDIEEKQLLETIQRMLEDGKLILGQQNRYGIKN